MFDLVQPNTWVVLQLPSDSLKVLEIIPNTIVSLGKYGTFSSNLIIDRPYHITYEILDRQPGQKDSELRVVPASEIHADVMAEENATSTPGTSDGVIKGGDGEEFQLLGENGEVLRRSNRETIDDSARQTLSMEEIEILKREGTGAGKEIIAKLMLSHTGLDQKTTFSLAKYKLTKTKKYLRRFTILPLDVPMLAHWMMEEKDSNKILEMREEMLALLGSWGNVHHAADPAATDLQDTSRGGRWLVVDETGGLLVAAIAERMGILYPEEDAETDAENEERSHPTVQENIPFAATNTITLIHANQQANLSLLKYFSFTPDNTTPSHPLSSHLLTLTWLQLVSPDLDTTLSNPPPSHTPTELSSMKPNKRGTYYRKRRRFLRTQHVIKSTLSGDFTGLLIASSMDPISVLQHTIPLLRGGAPISIYSPTIEPLSQLADLYSTSRRTAFIQSPPAELSDPNLTNAEIAKWPGNEDFPLNPTLLLNASVQTARVKEWQVLPGRTHPLMTGKGGAEGYLFTGVRVVPARGRVEARGNYKRRKEGVGVVNTDSNDGVVKKKIKNENENGDADIKMENTEAVESTSNVLAQPIES